jgi:nicotinamide mononucleotide transporter
MEWFATLLGLVYVLLIIRRSRIGWIAGGVSSSIGIAISVQAHLPMQALLHGFYVAMAVYGWWHWSAVEEKKPPIGIWPLWCHAVMIALCVLAALLAAQVLRISGASADWPLLDSLLTFLGLFGSWLTARMKLENWLYWLGIDAVSLYLYTVQGHPVIAALFLLYLVFAVMGLRSWWRQYQTQTPAV